MSYRERGWYVQPVPHLWDQLATPDAWSTLHLMDRITELTYTPGVPSKHGNLVVLSGKGIHRAYIKFAWCPFKD